VYENKRKRDKITDDLPAFFTKMHSLRVKDRQSSRIFGREVVDYGINRGEVTSGIFPGFQAIISCRWARRASRLGVGHAFLPGAGEVLLVPRDAAVDRVGEVPGLVESVPKQHLARTTGIDSKF
jgi:hypothetical protein